MKRALAILIAALPLWLTPPGAEAQVQYRYGIVTSNLGPQHGASVTDLQAGYVRLDFYWRNIEPSQDNYDWGSIDGSVNEALSRGFKIFATLSQAPSWAAPCDDGYCMPYNLADWQDFVATAIQRYGWTV